VDCGIVVILAVRRVGTKVVQRAIKRLEAKLRKLGVDDVELRRV